MQSQRCPKVLGELAAPEVVVRNVHREDIDACGIEDDSRSACVIGQR
jgi:hypothetical protein